MEYDVFISHSSKDKQITNAICHALESNGVKCWMAPRDVLPGVAYAGQLTNAIKNCKIFLLVFSNNSNNSGPVLREIEIAFGQEKTVIPFRIEQVEMQDSLEYYLSNLHWLDAYPDGEKFDNLVTAARNALGKNSRKNAPLATPTPKKSKKPFFIGGGVAVAAIIVAIILIVSGQNGEDSDYRPYTINEFPLAREIPMQIENRFETIIAGTENMQTHAEELESRARQGDTNAKTDLGAIFFVGHQDIPQDYETAAYWYSLAAQSGNHNAQAHLGKMYALGYGVTQNYARAVYWYRLAAAQGNVMAMTSLGIHYWHGIGMAQPCDEQMLYWIRLAAEQNHCDAQDILGFVYRQGREVPQIYARALYWYRQAAGQNHPGAQTSLGFMYAFGEGVEQCYEQAVYWYRQAAAQDNVFAMVMIGLSYRDAEGVEQCYVQTRYWMKKAAEMGDDDFAMMVLSDLYKYGNGVEQCYEQAAYWRNRSNMNW